MIKECEKSINDHEEKIEKFKQYIISEEELKENIVKELDQISAREKGE